MVNQYVATSGDLHWNQEISGVLYVKNKEVKC